MLCKKKVLILEFHWFNGHHAQHEIEYFFALIITNLIFQGKDPAGGANEANKALFLEKVRQSNSACQTGDFEKAISLYSEAIAMDKNNHILYSNR